MVRYFGVLLLLRLLLLDAVRAAAKNPSIDSDISTVQFVNLSSPHVTADDNIGLISNTIDSKVEEYYYLERPQDSKEKEESVILRTASKVAHVSEDHGATWKEVVNSNDILAIYPHPHITNAVYLITNTTEILVSTDFGKTFKLLKTPTAPALYSQFPILSFHKDHPDWLIWHGQADCSNPPGCPTQTHYSHNNGNSWTPLMSDVEQCMFVVGLQKPTDENLIFCGREVKISGPRTFVQLVSSTDYFKDAKNENVHFQDIIAFALQNDFLIVATLVDGVDLRMDVSVDGATFDHAHWPPSFKVEREQAYTILDTSTKAIVLHVTVSGQHGAEYGTILKSNSNGTSYVTSIENANRNEYGFVDFEKMQGIEGISIVNIVSNPKEAVGGDRKNLRSKITFDDGASWQFLAPPSVDSTGKATGCTTAGEDCSLNLHGYTERHDVRDTYSSASAVGLMVGVGNVGSSLTNFGDGNTYLTNDGGATWTELAKGTYLWEYGDQGSIIVLVENPAPTNTLRYTFDEGQTWQTLTFFDEYVDVYDISTVPSDTSRKFLIHAKQADAPGKTLLIQVDFTGARDVQCVLNERDKTHEDFELWEPSRPGTTTKCLFGHEIQYHRKIPDHLCYIGDKIPQPHTEVRNCSCTRLDYECDENYYLAADGSCILVSGYQPPDHLEWCRTFPSLIEYSEPTGYRKIPLSTCIGGEAWDKSTMHPCPGHEKEFGKLRRGIRGFVLFLLILLPFCMAGVVAYVLYNHYYGQYGQIRLGETDFDTHIGLGTDNGLLKYPIMAVSAVVAFVSALPVIATQLFTSWRGRAPRPSRLYRGRNGTDAFHLSRTNTTGRYQYAPVIVDDARAVRDDDTVFGSSDEDSDDDFAHVVPQEAYDIDHRTPSSPQLSAAPSSPPIESGTPPSPTDILPVSPSQSPSNPTK
ncbi:hypothetical protein V1520DRAFT_346352 [Lipomyces starkeyi]|uniref:VPS10 domain-containing protein n=1 Tax=Lipomyces starkeyi NRRL Y-11557 TaxID=675824 RepID=A0A1E3PWW7_LIPST|nr:hypothetical protein LIPSTDRAFT_6583 [Lipomyces starkeyi NRRL Y-11557]